MNSGGRDWSQHLRQIFDAGKQVAEELREENARLRERNTYLEHELERVPRRELEEFAQLKARLATLTQERDALSDELASLKSSLEATRAENGEMAEQYVEMERQNSNFISLYVASTQLHASLSHDGVLRNIQEIVINLIGAEKFGIYLYEPTTREFQRAAHEDMAEDELRRVPWGDNLFSEAAQAGVLYLAPTPEVAVAADAPLAIQPLVVAGELVGLLVIYRLLVQKDGFEAIDMELFELLAGHAATALMSSLLYRRSQRKAATLQGLIQLFKDADSLGDSAAG